MATRGRGRPALKWQLNKVDNIAEHLGTEIKDNFARVLFTEGTAEVIAERMITSASQKDPRYNNYSGNLNRSYMVMARSGNLRTYYLTNPNIAPMPQVTMNYRRNVNNRDDLGRFATDLRKKIKTKNGVSYVGRNRTTQARYFRITLKRHSRGLRALKSRKNDGGKQYESAKRNRFVRLIKALEQQYAGAGYMHQYTHLDLREKNGAYDVQARNAAAHFTLANLTPYAGYVEARGYRVLNYSKQGLYRKIVKEESGKALAVGVKWVCDQMNRDTRGRFTSKR